MHRMIAFVGLLLFMTDGSGAADFEVEQVKSPFVEKKDVGQMMASGHPGLSQHAMQATSPLQDYPYSTPQRKSRRCLSCHQSYGSSSSYSTGGMSSGGASLGSTSSFSFDSDSNYNQPLQSSSRHEFRKEQEFVNGQQVYDFHHEKRYKDGQLIDEKRHESGPDGYDGHHQPSDSSGYTSLSASSGVMGTLEHGGVPSNMYYENSYRGGGEVGYNSKFDEFTQKFHSEVERMREELERKAMSLPTHQLANHPSYGSSHRTEYRTQTKYVNGKPVYVFNEERKYKDGKLIHNVTQEKGPDDLGTATIPGSQPGSSLPYSGYPNYPINYAGSHSSYDSTSEFSSNTGTSYRPSTSGSSSRQAISSSSSSSYSPSNPAYTSSTYQSASQSSTDYLPNRRPYNTAGDTELPNPERPYTSSFSYPSSNQLYNTEVLQSHSQTSSGHYSRESPDNRDTTETPDNNRSNYNYITREPLSSSYPSSNPTYNSISQRAHYESSTNYNPNIQERPQVVNPDRSDFDSRTHYTHPSESNPSHSRSQSTYINSLHHTGRQTSTNYQLNTEDQVPNEDKDDSANPEYARPNRYNHITPTETTPRPSRYGYGTGRESYVTQERRLEETEQRRNTGDGYRPRINTVPHSGDKIKEASQTSYFESRRTRTRPGIHDTSVSTNDIRVVDQNQAPRVRQYRPAVRRTSHEVRKETERGYQTPRYGHRVNETSRIYEPRTQSTATSTWEENQMSSSPGYQSPDISYRPGRYGPSKDDDDDDDDTPHNGPKHAIPPASYPGARNYGRAPERNEDSREDEEQGERSDISPYDDVSDVDIEENEIDTNRHRPDDYLTHQTNTGPIYDRARSHVYEESQSETREQTMGYGHQPVRVPQQDGPTERPSRAYSIQNSSRTDHRVTTVIPSRWVETRTTWEYINGRVESETQHHRFYEDGILVHENTTHKTREEMENAGQDVESLDLSPSQLAEYGQSLPSTTHSQKHEIYQIQRFRNGRKTYEMNHERQFQDGVLMLENKEEKNEDDFKEDRPLSSPHGSTGDNPIGNHLENEHIGARSQVGADELYHIRMGSPRSYINKHEVRKEEEYVNGQKVYDFHHEREYQDGKLVRENRTELGPDDLGASEGVGIQRHASRNLIRGSAHNAIDESSLLEQRTGANGILKTTCLTCGGSHLRAIHQGGTAMNTHGYNSDSLLSREESMRTMETSQSALGSHPGLRHAGGSSFRHDVEVEEHYENGQLVKGREESKKWRDGALVDADQEHYYDGPSRVGKISSLVSEVDSTAAFTSSPTRTIARRRGNECASNPCQNRGRCRSNGSRPVCSCPFGFKGEFCEEAYCPNRYCRYGGSCSISRGKHMCQCLEGYSGHRCSTKEYRTHG